MDTKTARFISTNQGIYVPVDANGVYEGSVMSASFGGKDVYLLVNRIYGTEWMVDEDLKLTGINVFADVEVVPEERPAKRLPHDHMTIRIQPGHPLPILGTPILFKGSYGYSYILTPKRILSAGWTDENTVQIRMTSSTRKAINLASEEQE